jgi:steroid delta-isomerase-like uncharacterized protein
MISSLIANLRVRLLVLVLIAVLPALALLIFTALEQRDQAVAAAQAETRRLANLAAADQNRIIESTRQLLTTLARLPDVREGESACSAVLADLRGQFPVYANLGLISPSGVLTCSAVPPAEPEYFGDRSYFQRAIATGAFTVGEYVVGRVTGKPSLICSYPVYAEDGALIGVLFAAIDLTALGPFPVEEELPPDAILTVFDRSGTILLQRPQTAGNAMGQSALGTPIVQTMLQQGSGVAEGEERDQTYLYAFASLGVASPDNAYLSIAVPKASVVAPAEQAFARQLTRLGLVVLVVLIAAWVGGDLLGRRNTEEHKVLVRRVYDAFATGGVDELDEVVASDFQDRDPMPGQAPGLAGLKEAVSLFRLAFPDGQMIVDDLVAEGDKVVARVTMRGTHRGPYFGLEPSGQLVTAHGVEVYRIAEGKIVEGWSRFVPPVPEDEVVGA